MKTAQIQVLARRARQAAARGFKLGLGEHYAKSLMSKLGIEGPVDGSAANVARLCDLYDLYLKGPMPPKVEVEPEPPEEDPEAAPEEEAEAEPEEEPEAEAEPEAGEAAAEEAVEAPEAVEEAPAESDEAPAPEGEPEAAEGEPEATEKASSYEALTKAELLELATARDISGRHGMNKAELVEALTLSDVG